MVNPLPVQAFANILFYHHIILRIYIPCYMHPSQLFYELAWKLSHGSVASFMIVDLETTGRKVGKKIYFSEVIVQSNTLPLCKHDDYYKYLGKSMTLCVEDE